MVDLLEGRRAYVRSWTVMHDAGTCRGSRIRFPREKWCWSCLFLYGFLE
jgi:hypothetical protein